MKANIVLILMTQHSFAVAICFHMLSNVLISFETLATHVFLCFVNSLFGFGFISVMIVNVDDCQCENFLLYRIRPIISHCKALAAFLS